MTHNKRRTFGCQIRSVHKAFPLVAVLLVAPLLTYAQIDGDPVEDRWIVLLDASSSFEQIDQQLSQQIRNPAYRLRNELLALLQVLLGTVDDVDNRRSSFLRVYFFGQGVEEVSGLPSWPLHLEDAKDEGWWEQRQPQSLARRTEFLPALERVADDFSKMSSGARKHLLIISDGELDCCRINRAPGAPFQDEERREYDRLMEPGQPPVSLLHSLGVSVYTVAIDQLAAAGEVQRQEIIRKKLNSMGRASVQQDFVSLLDELQGQIEATGRQPYSEGPYFLAALAEALGGQSRSVTPQNLPDVVWETIFPEAVRTSKVAPGALSLVVFAPAESPVRLCVTENGTTQNLTLRYDSQKMEYSREPSTSTADVRVRHRATSRYATWLIEAPDVTCVDPPSAYHGNNLELRWLPEDQIYTGEPLPIRLALTRWSNRPPSPEWWREFLSSGIGRQTVKATANVDLPNGSRIVDLPLMLELGAGSEIIATLTGELTRVDLPGSYQLEATLKDTRDGWEETVQPRTTLIVPISWSVRIRRITRSFWWMVPLLLGALLVYVYRERLPWLTPQAPFDFSVLNKEKIVFTESIHRKAIRFTAGSEGIQVDLGQKKTGRGPTVIFEPIDRTSYRYGLRPRTGHGWEYRQTDKGRQPGQYLPLGQNGLEIRFEDFVKGSSLDLKFRDHVVQIRHSSYSNLRGATAWPS